MIDILLLNFFSAVILSTVGVYCGWWLRGKGAGRRVDEKNAEQRRHTLEALARLHDLTARVAADVGQHSSRVREINEELTTVDTDDAETVVEAVTKLIQVNEQMQEQLASAEVKLHEQQRQTESLAAEARTDPLTQLANRRALDDELARRRDQCRRYGRNVSIMMFDLDHFKRFNDTHGHQAGDEVLRGVARVLRQTMREGDLVARYGGEEFAVVLPDSDIEKAKRSVERARKAIDASRFQFEGVDLHVTASIGVAQLSSGEEIEATVQRADAALYASKEGGRNCGHWHDGKTSHRIAASAENAPPQTGGKPEPDSDPPAAPADVRTDAVTGLSNRAAFFEDTRRRLAEWRRGGSPLSVILVEIDGYAAIRRRSGEQVGDTVLHVATQFLQAAMREMDYVARYDDKTFALLLPGARLADATQVGERLRLAVSRCALPMAEGRLQFTVSLGVTEAVQGDDPEQLLQRTEAALEAAVEHGRNRSFVHDGDHCRLASMDLPAPS